MFTHECVSEKDKELLLGPFEDSDGPMFTFNDNHSTIAHLLHIGGCFKSISAARKNGWDKPIPPGYTQFSFGKTYLKVYIVNVW